MTFIVTSILSSTVGLLWNKARDASAAKLKDGDVTDARIREILVRELNDVKTKIDGLSRANLLSSYRFLKEGVDLLNDSLDKSSTMPSGVESDILNEALQLSHAMGKLKIDSDKEFESAKKRFEEARKTATHAFCNEALSIKDRIFAAKLRIISEILECLDSPETAITGCLSFLQELHRLPAIREMFSVYLNGGVKSRLKKAEREENVKSVMLINYVLFHFNLKFSRKLTDRLIWPDIGIKLTGRSFNPIFDWQEVSTRKSWGEELSQPRNELILDEKIYPNVSAVNSRAETVVSPAVYSDNISAISTISRTGESKVVILPDPREGKIIKQCIAGLAVDNSNNVYAIRWLQTSTGSGNVKGYVLCILDENYNAKYDCILDFLKATDLHYMSIAISINKNNDIIMIKIGDPHVYVCGNTGQLKYKFERDSRVAFSLGISRQSEIMIPTDDLKAVEIYTEEGNLKSTITVPEGHNVYGVAFHYVICKILVLTCVREKGSHFLLCYTETGEHETSTLFCNLNDGKGHPFITSHPSGPVAVVRKEIITFI